MSEVEKVKLEFTPDYIGQMEVKNGIVKMGVGAMSPYNLLFGALGGCLYHTFLDIVVKKRLSFNNVKIEIAGIKRETVPTTLESVNIKFVIQGASNEKQFTKSVELAEQYCSVHATISQVAQIKLDLIFE